MIQDLSFISVSVYKDFMDFMDLMDFRLLLCQYQNRGTPSNEEMQSANDLQLNRWRRKNVQNAERIKFPTEHALIVDFTKGKKS